MAEAEPTAGVDVFGRARTFLDQADRLVPHGEQDAVDGEADHVLHLDRALADLLADLGRSRHHLGIAVEAGDHLDQLHAADRREEVQARSEEHTSELQSLMRSSYAVFGLKTKILLTQKQQYDNHQH